MYLFFVAFSKYKVKDMRVEKLLPKNICKLAVRLQAKFKLSMAECCPNIRRDKCGKNVRYLIYRRYVERSMEYEPWQELCMECLLMEGTGLTSLAESFVEMLADHGDYREIHKWLGWLRIDRASLSSYIVTNLSDELRRQALPDSSNKSLWYMAQVTPPGLVDERFHKLKLADDQIEMVDSMSALERFLAELEAQVARLASDDELVFVGVDSEWKPTFLTDTYDDESDALGSSGSAVALLQVATRHRVFLVDMFTLSRHFAAKPLDARHFLERFLYNKRIVKIGYSFANDVKMLCNAFVGGGDHMELDVDAFRRTVLDMAHLVEHLLKLTASRGLKLFENSSQQQAPVASSKDENKGLSELVRQCFGKPLNKAEQ